MDQERNEQPHLYGLYVPRGFSWSLGVEWFLVDDVGLDFRSYV